MRIHSLARAKASLFTVTAASLCLVLAGCTSSSGEATAAPPTSSSATPPPTSAAPPTSASVKPVLSVEWMDGYCQAINEFREDHNRVLSAGGSSPKELTGQLAPYSDALTKAIDRLKALPPAPDPKGDEAKKPFLDNYTAARDKYAEAKAKLDKGKNSTASQNSALTLMIDAQGTAMKAFDPVSSVMSSAELSTASAGATHCTHP